MAESGSQAEAEQAARDAFADDEPTPLKNLAERANADGRYADAARLFRYAVTLYELRRKQRTAGTEIIDFEAGPRALTDFIDSRTLPMPPGETWALRQLVELLDRTEGDRSGDDELRQAADSGNAWALEQMLRRLRARGEEQDAEALLQSKATQGDPWALWAMAHDSLNRRPAGGSLSRTLLERASAAHVGQAITVLMDQAEQAGLIGEADRWALHAAARGYTKPLQALITRRAKVGRIAAAENLAWQAPGRERSLGLRRLVQGRTDAEALALLQRAHDEAIAWAPGLLAAYWEATGVLEKAEYFARRAADGGDRQTLEDLAGQRAADDPHRMWRSMLSNGLTANGTPADSW